MNQVKEQFVFDLQLFADDSPADGSAESAPDSAVDGATETDTESESFGTLDQDAQIDYVQKHFLSDDEDSDTDNKDDGASGQVAESPQPNTQSQPERMVTLTHNGKQVQVPESEAINLAMQGYDYTQKMQALAAERRHYEQLIAQMSAGQQAKQEQPNPIDAGYDAAVAATEKVLGLNQGEFNQFDPKHLYVLQQVAAEGALRQREQVYAQQAAVAEQQEVVQAMGRLDKIIKSEPLSQQIIDNYEKYIYKYCTNADGVLKATKIGQALERYYKGRCVRGDDKLLEEHWNFVKKDLQKKVKPTVRPPMTESPGVGTSNNAPKVFSGQKVRELADDPDAQLQYLVASGVLD